MGRCACRFLLYAVPPEKSSHAELYEKRMMGLIVCDRPDVHAPEDAEKSFQGCAGCFRGPVSAVRGGSAGWGFSCGRKLR